MSSPLPRFTTVHRARLSKYFLSSELSSKSETATQSFDEKLAAKVSFTTIFWQHLIT